MFRKRAKQNTGFKGFTKTDKKMTLKEQEKAIKLFAALVVAVCMIIIMLMPTKSNAQSMAREHAKLQKELSFQTWQSKQAKTRIRTAKESLRQAKDSNKSIRQADKINRKEDRILAKIER